MTDDEHRSQEEILEQLIADVEREAARVGVDWDAAGDRLRAMAPQTETMSADGESMDVTIGLDVTSLLDTLRTLPDSAGTDAFLEAMEER